MYIEKVINNNIVSSKDEKGREIVVMGRGIGFQVKSGQQIDTKKVEKIFRMETEEEAEQLQSVLADIPLLHIQLSNDIIAYAKEIIGKPLNKNIYITLTDHINFAIIRYQKGIAFHNALTWEVKRFYPMEFKVGQKAVLWIKERLDIDLPEDEATSIALHFVNAQLGGKMPETIDITKFIQSVLKIVTYHFQITLDEYSINYERFIIHLKFFAQRIIRNEQNEHDDEVLYDMIKNRYSMEYQCAGKIKNYVEKEFSIHLPEEEMVYLTVHIRRIRADKNKAIID